MDGCTFDIAFAGEACRAFLIKKGGNGAVFCVTNSDGDSKALKLYNATVFMCKLYNPLTNYQRDCIYSAFEGRVEGIYFRSDLNITIRYFDIHRYADDESKELDCAAILESMGIHVYYYQAVEESGTVVEHDIRHTIPFNNCNDLIVMPLTGPDLHTMSPLPPDEVNKLLLILYEAAESAVDHKLCLNDIKPENICMHNGTYTIVDVEDLPEEYSGGQHSTYVVTEFGKNGTSQMFAQIALTVAYCSGRIDGSMLLHFWQDVKEKENPSRFDLFSITPLELHSYIESIGVKSTADTLQLLHEAALSAPYKVDACR